MSLENDKGFAYIGFDLSQGNGNAKKEIQKKYPDPNVIA